MSSIISQALREELEHAHPEMDSLHEGGEELIDLIGEPDKPEVEKNVEDVEHTWDDVTNKCDTRQQRLDDALRKATAFHEQLLVCLLTKVAFHCAYL